MISVTILAGDFKACGYYRLIGPLTKLHERGEIKLSARATRRPDGSLIPAMDSSAFVESDVVILQKAADADLAPFLRDHGRKVVMEVDDDVTTITKDNPVYTEELIRKPGFVGRLRANAGACRLMTVTTPHLAAVSRGMNDAVRVVPNGLDLAGWGAPDVAPDDGVRPLRIGYLASPNHVEDARLLHRPFREIALRFPRVQFVLAGAFYRDLKKHIGDRLEIHQGVGIEEYPAFARSLALDIGVAPLVDSRFARSKSPLKWLEYSALGVPMVASPVEPYAQVVTHGVTGMLARSAADWVAHLASLVSDADQRRTIAAAALADVTSRFTMDHSADAWLAVLKEVAA